MIGLTACAGSGGAPAQYDWGPLASMGAPADKRPVLVLDVQSVQALDSTAMLYRLSYADAQQLRAYRDARWGVTPQALVQQHWRTALGRNYLLAPPSEMAPQHLTIEIEEMNQIFDRTDHSFARLRLRVSLSKRSSEGLKLVAQREGVWDQACASADAAGGAHAMALANQAAQEDIAQWLGKLH
jgi:cholesterol transport system auxiliary component